MAKKLFTVHRNCYATIDIEVAAESEEEAIKLAESRFEQIPAKEYEFSENDVRVIDANDMPNVDELMEEVTQRIAELAHTDDFCLLVDPVEVHLTSLDWNNDFCISEEVEHTHNVEGIYNNEGYLYLQFEDCHADDVELSELDEPDQLAVLLKAQEKLNSLT